MNRKLNLAKKFLRVKRNKKLKSQSPRKQTFSMKRKNMSRVTRNQEYLSKSRSIRRENKSTQRASRPQQCQSCFLLCIIVL
ncbi:unnamed protein product [Moneuplotes crassus]|uniref:Uncharacterized protein n=1 Tax=Euplotes crassus TaxID=5936 RepID=A0AAD1XUB2_EUPCR|nr:unnamed protein product [Moneuplotes crassus]